MEFDPSSMTDECYHLLIMSLCYRDRELTRRSMEAKLEAMDIERASVLMQINALKQEISIRKDNIQCMLFSFPKKATLSEVTDSETGSLREISSSRVEVDTSCRKYMLKSLYVDRASREAYSDIFNIFHNYQCSMLCVDDGDASRIVDVTEVMRDSFGWFPCFLCHDKVILSSFCT